LYAFTFHPVTINNKETDLILYVNSNVTQNEIYIYILYINTDTGLGLHEGD